MTTHFFKLRLFSSQLGFRKQNFISANKVTYLNVVVLSVSAVGQTDSVCFDLSDAFDIVSYSLFLPKVNDFGLSSAYVNWFHSYLTNSTCGTPSFWYVMKTGVPQGAT
jgi:hypothetical protein